MQVDEERRDFRHTPSPKGGEGDFSKKIKSPLGEKEFA